MNILRKKELFRDRVIRLRTEKDDLLYEQEIKIQNIREIYIEKLAIAEAKIKQAELMQKDSHEIHRFIK